MKPKEIKEKMLSRTFDIHLQTNKTIDIGYINKTKCMKRLHICFFFNFNFLRSFYLFERVFVDSFVRSETWTKYTLTCMK